MATDARGGGGGDGPVLACRIFGHRFRFVAEGTTMMWSCSRCGHVGGTKTYATPAKAAHFAKAFDTSDDDDLGRRAPLVGLFPLRIARSIRRGRQQRREQFEREQQRREQQQRDEQ